MYFIIKIYAKKYKPFDLRSEKRDIKIAFSANQAKKLHNNRTFSENFLQWKISVILFIILNYQR